MKIAICGNRQVRTKDVEITTKNNNIIFTCPKCHAKVMFISERKEEEGIRPHVAFFRHVRRNGCTHLMPENYYDMAMDSMNLMKQNEKNPNTVERTGFPNLKQNRGYAGAYVKLGNIWHCAATHI